MTPLVDIGANLAHRSFRDDLPEVLARARARGVGHLIVTGTGVGASQRALELAHEHAGLSCTAGVHPHEARTYGRGTTTSLRELLRDPRVVAVGECGLDYDRDFSPREAQRDAFRAQLALAAETGHPVFLHERAAGSDFLAIVREARPRGVVHCFTADAAALEAYLALGLYIGITGWICDPRRGAGLAHLVSRVPHDRLLIETDAPFLTPKPRTGRNEPAFLPDVLARVAACAGRSVERVAVETTRNAAALFGPRVLV